MIKQALDAIDKATPGPWIVECNEIIQKRGDIASDQRDIAYLNPEAGDAEDFASSTAVEGNGIILAAAPDMAAWIKRALPLLKDAQCGIDNAFGEGSKICAQIDALIKEATE